MMAASTRYPRTRLRTRRTNMSATRRQRPIATIQNVNRPASNTAATNGSSRLNPLVRANAATAHAITTKITVRTVTTLIAPTWRLSDEAGAADATRFALTQMESGICQSRGFDRGGG